MNEKADPGLVSKPSAYVPSTRKRIIEEQEEMALADPSELSELSIIEFQQLWKAHSGEDLSRDQAIREAKCLIELVKVLHDIE